MSHIIFVCQNPRRQLEQRKAAPKEDRRSSQESWQRTKESSRTEEVWANMRLGGSELTKVQGTKGNYNVVPEPISGKERVPTLKQLRKREAQSRRTRAPFARGDRLRKCYHWFCSFRVE